MKTTKFLDQVRDAEIVEAIRAAERKTSGEIRVFITQKAVADPVTAAEQHFVKMGMHKTGERNGVLIFVAPRSQQFAVVGDAGVHARCGPEFWTEVAASVSDRFKQSDFTGGIAHAIGKAGALLAEHFPRQSDDRNELSDQIARD